jgi:hypothetical protein
MLEGDHDPLFPLTRPARRCLIAKMKTDNVGNLGSVKYGALSQLSGVVSYDEPAPTQDSGLIVSQDLH